MLNDIRNYPYYSTFLALCILGIILMLNGCSTPVEETRTVLDRLEFEEGEEGCVRIDGQIDLNPLPLFKTNASLTLKKNTGEGAPEC